MDDLISVGSILVRFTLCVRLRPGVFHGSEKAGSRPALKRSESALGFPVAESRTELKIGTCIAKLACGLDDGLHSAQLGAGKIGWCFAQK
jgi:hypothetical protein